MSKERRIETILQFLDEKDAMFAPKILYDNLCAYEDIGFTYRTVKRLLDELHEDRLIEYVDTSKGYYRISDRGRDFLDNQLSNERFSFSVGLQEELNRRQEEIEEKFPEANPKLARVAPGEIGLWIRFNPGDQHSVLLGAISEVGDYLAKKGYWHKWVHDSPYNPNLGEPHYEGHIHALPRQIGEPEEPLGRMPSMDPNKFEAGEYIPD